MLSKVAICHGDEDVKVCAMLSTLDCLKTAISVRDHHISLRRHPGRAGAGKLDYMCYVA